MPEKKTIEEVRQRIFDLSNGKAVLLSNEYINSRQKLKIQCECGNIFERDFSHINRGSILCKECSKKERLSTIRYNIEYIKDKIAESGCEYISGDYKNSSSILKIKCRCGNIFEKSWNKFQSGQDRCLECAKKNTIEAVTKYSKEDVEKLLSEYGYTMIGEYTNASTKVKCICAHGHECDIILSQLLVHRSGCQKCALEKRSGLNHWNYKGGVSILEDVIRQSLDSWKKSIREYYNYRCPITGNSGLETVVHHLYSLNNIFNDVVNELKVNVNDKQSTINAFEDESEYYLLINKIIEKHNLETGILISKDIHIQFHKEYGYGNNTPQQFNEFLLNNYNISLEEIQKGKVYY